MIVGIGTDICDIRRIEKSIEKYGDRYLNKIFTKGERDYCESKSGPSGYYAKRWSAKEAAAKALASENSGALSWKDVEVFNHPSGLPNLRLHGGAKKRLSESTPKGYTANIYVSMTDDYPYAQAFVIVECVPLDESSRKKHE